MTFLPTIEATVQRGSIQFLMTMGHTNSIVFGLLLVMIGARISQPLPPDKNWLPCMFFVLIMHELL